MTGSWMRERSNEREVEWEEKVILIILNIVIKDASCCN